MRKQRKFCSWCIVKPFHRMAFGNRVFNGDCYRRGPYHYRLFKVSKVLVAAHTLITFLVICVTYHFIEELMAATNILDFNHRCHCAYLGNLLVMLKYLFAVPLTHHPNYYELMDEIVEYYTPLGILGITQRELKRVTELNRWVGYSIGLQFALVPGAYLLDYFLTQQVDWMEMFALWTAYYIFSTVILNCACLLACYKVIVRNAFKLFKRNCAKRYFQFEKYDFRKRVALFTEFYREASKALFMFVDFLSSFLHVTIIGVTTYIIAENTILVEMFINKDLSNFQKKVGVTVVILGNAVLLYSLALMKYVDTLRDEGDNLCSFLSRSKLRRLKDAEILQLEALTSALNTLRPVLRIADLFVVDSRLIATMSGFVVTYILVVMQFYLYF